jgi:hypothetical protein
MQGLRWIEVVEGVVEAIFWAMDGVLVNFRRCCDERRW